MKYLSANETAEKWKISSTRIRILAETGRIVGAQFVGNSWIIPQDAQKPFDGRTKAGKQNKNAYRFPLLVFGNYTKDEIMTFSEEERNLYEAQTLYCCCKFTEAKKLLENILSRTNNLYVKIGCLYYLCFAYQHTREFDKVEDTLFSVRLLFESDFDYKNELIFILYDLMLMFDNTQKVLHSDNLDLPAPYSKKAEVFILAEEACVELMKQIEGITKINTTVFEIICERLESDNYYVPAMYMHYYIGTMYELDRQIDRARHHAAKAIKLAKESNCYAPLFGLTFSNFEIYESLVQELSQEEKENALKFHKIFKDDISDYYEHTKKTFFYSKLSDEDFKFASYVVMNYPNKKIAKLENLSESTVNKKLMGIYEKLGISGKKEFCELAVSSVTNKQ